MLASHLSVNLSGVYAQMIFICEPADDVEGVADVAADKPGLSSDSVTRVGAVVTYEGYKKRRI